MANVTIRGIEDEVIARFRRRAAAAGRSLEEELRRVLRRAASLDRERSRAWIDDHKLVGPPDADIVELIREGRDSR